MIGRWVVLVAGWLALIVGVALMGAASAHAWHLVLGGIAIGVALAVVVPRLWRSGTTKSAPPASPKAD